MNTGKISVMEGSAAIAQAVRACRPGVISSYPITPQTHIVETLAKMVANGELDCEYIRADSEFSAASIIAGASAAGVRAYTASSSQGLMLMTEVIYYLAGSRLPVVFTGTNRQVSPPIGLQPDHQDTMSLRDAGLIQLYAEDVQEAYDMHLQAFRIAEDPRVLFPVMVCVDGFVLTHVFEPVRIFEQADVDAFLPPYEPTHRLDVRRPAAFGTIADDPYLLEIRYITQQAARASASQVEAVARQYQEQFGHYRGGLIDTYATEDAEIILVAMGSVLGTLREAVDTLRAEGIQVGLLKVRCFRPFPSEELRAALQHTGVAVVLDRALSIGAGGVLAGEVKSALYDLPTAPRPQVLSLLAGYGGREVTLATVRTIVEQARRILDEGRAPAAEVEFVGLKPELLPAGVKLP